MVSDGRVALGVGRSPEPTELPTSGGIDESFLVPGPPPGGAGRVRRPGPERLGRPAAFAAAVLLVVAEVVEARLPLPPLPLQAARKFHWLQAPLRHLPPVEAEAPVLLQPR